jgi:hypothetical protein
MGKCHNSGVDTFKMCPMELHFEKLISWKNIGYEIVGFTKEGKEKVSKMEYNETPPCAFIQYLKPHLEGICVSQLHRKVARCAF